MKNITKNSIIIAFVLGMALTASPAFARDIINPPVIGVPQATTLSATNVGETSATLRGSVATNGNSTNTWFDYGTSQSFGSKVNGPSTSNSVSFSKNISGLNPGTTYYFRACAANVVDQTDCGNTLSFTTDGTNNQTPAPVVYTNTATNIGETSARLNGSWSASNDVLTWFTYSESHSTVSNGSGNTTSKVAQGIGSYNMSQTITNLKPGTTYYFRAHADNLFGSNMGAVMSFTTEDNSSNSSEAEVTTKSAINVTEDSATLKGEIETETDADYWFEYGTSSNNLSKETSVSSIDDGSHSVSKNISGLMSDKTYYFRLVAENDEGTSYGSVKSFTTEDENNNNNNNDEELIVSTLASSAVSQTTAKVNGSVIDDLGDYSVSVWFEYGTTVALGNSTNSKNLGKIDSESFSDTLTNLSPNTVYYFRAVGKNTNGTIRGDVKVFKTIAIVLPPNPPVNPPVNPPTNNPVSGTITSKFIALKIENKYENVSAGDVIEYEVTFTNISSKDIKDAVLEVRLPALVSFEKSSKGEFNKDSLVLKLDLLEAGDEEKVIISGSVSRGANTEDVLLATATVFYPNPITKIKENVTAYVVNNVVEKNLLPAASIFGNDGFLPNTLTEWALLIGAIFALIYFGRKFYADINVPKA